MSTALSGPAAALGKDMREGVLAGFERANRAGGVNGRKLRLVALDDGYEPSRTAPNMRQLIDKENVLAVIGNVGTPTAIVAIPIAIEQKTLFFAAYTGAGLLRNKPPDRYVINYRASYAEEAGTMIDGLLGDLGFKPEEIAFFTQRDGYGDAGFNGGVAALKRHGLTDEKGIMHVRYERNTLAVENAVASLIVAEHPPRAIVMVGAYAPCAKFIQQCREAGLRALFLNVSFVGSTPLAKELGKTDAPVVVMQVVPSPLDMSLPIVREYFADLHSLDPSAPPSFGDLEGYIAARIFITALEKIKDMPTRESIVDALEGLGKFDIGLGESLDLGPEEHQACHRVWPTILRDGAFTPFRWKDIAGLVKTDLGP
jgi:ABC-type branched-subunit amino acid transport system substrate-binding protein